jgi:Alr-MurF fusion protein
MKFSLSEISKITQASITGKADVPEKLSYLLTDSRKLLHAEETVFFALKTSLRDGHGFVKSLYERGVRVFVVNSDFLYNETEMPEATFLHVPSTLLALQQIAAFHRNQFSVPAIAVTGSNGKTIVKEWLYHLLSQFSKAVRSPKSYNSQIGVPLSVALLEDVHDYAVFEAGISHPGEMESLERIIMPGYGIFTTIGPPHDENFQSLNQKIREKLLLFKNTKQVVVHDQKIIKTATESGILKQEQLFTWGEKSENHIVVSEVSSKDNYSCFKIQVSGQPIEFIIPFTDNASKENAMHCFAAMVMLGFDPAEVAPHMQSLPVVAMRLELHDGINNCLIINDAYNSDMHSLSIALDFLTQQQQQRKACVILSDMLQTGIAPEHLYEQAATMLTSKNVDRFIGIGPGISSFRHKFVAIPDAECYRDTDHFINQVKFSDFQNEIILIKGARDFAFERIVRNLENKLHQTVLEVNLNAIVHNLNVYKSLLKPETSIMAMVKAFSYGTGSHEIAGLLEYHHLSYLGVAYADEGIALRNKGITLPVMVMAPEKTSLEAMIEHNLEPEIYHFDSLGWLKDYPTDTVRIHLKFNTGMNRLGFDLSEIPQLCSQLKVMSNVKVMSVFSHLAAADAPEGKEITEKQIKLFDRMYDLFATQSGVFPKKHILNSAGISFFGKYQYDMVRLGLGLYGIQPTHGKKLPLQQTVKLKTSIIQIKHIEAGERVGYDPSFVAASSMKIAIIPIGYADGFRRSLSNGKGYVFIKGKKCKVVGNVCMDMTIIEVSGMDVSVGDSVSVFDEHYTISDFAKNMGVIPYEVLTGISQRVKRQYHME